jgi:lysozyme
MMDLSDNGLDLAKEFEGLREKMPDGRIAAYQQSYTDKATGKVTLDVPTIGYGCTKGVHMGMIWTLEECEAGLRRELADTIRGVNKLLRVPVNQNEFDALVLFAYNLGYSEGGLGGSTLLRKLNDGDKAGAALEFTRWVYRDKVFIQGLLNRRVREAELFSRPIEGKSPADAALVPQSGVAPLPEKPAPIFSPAVKTTAGTVAGGLGLQVGEALLAPPPVAAVQTVDNLSAWQALGTKASNLGAALWSSPEAMGVALGVSLACIWLPVAWRWARG